MGKFSRDKGLRAERDIIARHELIGVYCERVPLSGGTLYKGNRCDVDLYINGRDEAPLVAEVKARASGSGFALLERWLSNADVLFLRRDRADPIVVLPWSSWVRLVSP